jgi:flagellar hook-associated protein 3 FlgL
MKISTNQYFTSLNKQMTAQQSKIAESQAQLATGKKAVTPSSDLEATTSTLRLQSVISKQSDYVANLNSLEDRLVNEEGAISAMQDMVYRMQELAIAARSNTYSAQDVSYMATEAEGYLIDIKALANSVDMNGRYIFAGTATTTQPFVTLDSGETEYRGNQAEVALEVDGGYKLNLNTSGYNLAGRFDRVADDGSTSKVDMFTVMTDFVNALKANDPDAIGTTMDELDSVSNHLGSQVVDLGVRQNLITQRKEIAADKQIIYENLLSEAQDIDFSKAITQLSSDMLALEAAQSTFAKVTQLSLFNFI